MQIYRYTTEIKHGDNGPFDKSDISRRIEGVMIIEKKPKFGLSLL